MVAFSIPVVFSTPVDFSTPEIPIIRLPYDPHRSNADTRTFSTKVDETGNRAWILGFEKLVHYKKENGQYNIDFGKFHNVYSINTPTCSAAEIERLRTEGTFNESDYQMYPPSDNKLNLLDNDELSPVRDSMDLSNQIQILRRDSDEDPDAGEESMELVDLGIHHKCSIRSQSPIINSTAHLLQPMHKNSCSVRRGSSTLNVSLHG
ncbi:hypothetical protein B9Z55_022265 [Caenorhabditis nigoni]|uniref:Inward rectifier potassium channel C-terminal domain-containing protein n=1 Tax=Caenorhabditis nigoni TaxID=1611254 RepID=A0A2G5SJB6_9PELO|nr:hypothetical protein B9Z55_022265 [Caenorhabditis nigoni]